VTLQH